MKSPEIQYAIKFDRFNVTKCNVISDPNLKSEDLKDIAIEFKFGTGFSDAESNKFQVSFIISLSLKKEDLSRLSLEIEAICDFSTNVQITENFKESDFALINAPAIGFPFLRSFIQTLCVNIGIPPIILPSFNFAAAKKIEDIK